MRWGPWRGSNIERGHLVSASLDLGRASAGRNIVLDVVKAQQVVLVLWAGNFESGQVHPGSITLSRDERRMRIAEGNIEDSRMALIAGR